MLFLILIPFNFILLFTRCLSRFQRINYFKPLLDAFQGSQKDNFYYWIALHIVVRNTFLGLYAVNTITRLTISAVFLVIFGLASGYIQPYKKRFQNIQELFLLTNLTILYGIAACYHNYNTDVTFSITANILLTTTLLHFSTIMMCHFLIFTCHCNVIKILLGKA